MATGVLIHHKAKKKKEKGMKKKETNMHCRVRWEEDLVALVPVSSSGAGPVAEQCVLKMHVSSSSTWAVSFGSVSSI